MYLLKGSCDLLGVFCPKMLMMFYFQIWNVASAREWDFHCGNGLVVLRMRICAPSREHWLLILFKTWPIGLPYPAVGHGQKGGVECSNSWIYLGVTEMSVWNGQRKSLLEKRNWGSMPPDNPRWALPLRVLLLRITHNLYHYDLMTLLKNVCTHHWVRTGKILQIGPCAC